jgi:lipopolysaccharide transport system ATP-binding protein
MKPILEIQNISKKFTINREQQPYLSLRDSISQVFKSKKSTEDFWALDNVSFNVEAGDTVGIIGKNGAGKSTLLKILSKITPPTSGKIVGRGRIASLLEVGTGFHPELSGRENIFMNGSILGMRRAEILKNFDAIVDFAGVEKFIDTPLKHYSSGMQLRLAFAVAAFLENEILIIDEVLAVGDMEFQKKCMNKMRDVSKTGRTILFVSHNMLSLTNLCTKGILLNNGKLLYQGELKTAIEKYLSPGKSSEESSHYIRKGKGNFLIKKCFLQNSKGIQTDIFFSGEDLSIVFDYESTYDSINSLHFAIAIKGSYGEQIADISDFAVGDCWKNVKSSGRITCTLPHIPLNTGKYSFNAICMINNEIEDWILDIESFYIEAGDFYKTGVIPDANQGYFLFNQNWKVS